MEREAEAGKVVLVCRECGGEMRVDEDTDLALLVWEWEEGVREVGGDPEVYQPTPPDVFVITEHPCSAGWESLEEKATGKPWPAFMDAGGGTIGLTR